MARRGNMAKTGGVVPKASKPSAVSAIFSPAGAIHARVTAPSGNEYEIEPRVPFRVAGEDVEWLFHGWNSEHRQCLTREKDYQPGPQFDNGKATREVRTEKPVEVPKVEAPTLEPKPVVALVIASEAKEPAPVAEAVEDESEKSDA